MGRYKRKGDFTMKNLVTPVAVHTHTSNSLNIEFVYNNIDDDNLILDG